jgi:hypothetical protein
VAASGARVRARRRAEERRAERRGEGTIAERAAAAVRAAGMRHSMLWRRLLLLPADTDMWRHIGDTRQPYTVFLVSGSAKEEIE